MVELSKKKPEKSQFGVNDKVEAEVVRAGKVVRDNANDQNHRKGE